MKKITFLLLVLLLLLSMISCNSPKTTDKTDDGSDDTSEKNNESTDDSIGDNDDEEEENGTDNEDNEDDIDECYGILQISSDSLDDIRKKAVGNSFPTEDIEYILDLSSLITEAELDKISVQYHGDYDTESIRAVEYSYKNSKFYVRILKSPFSLYNDFDILRKTAPMFESIEEIRESEYSGYCFLKNDICGVMLSVNESSQVYEVEVFFNKIAITFYVYTGSNTQTEDALGNEFFSDFEATESALEIIEKIVSLIPESKKQTEDLPYVKLKPSDHESYHPALHFDSLEKLEMYVRTPEYQGEIKFDADDYFDFAAFIPKEEVAACYYFYSAEGMILRTVSGERIFLTGGRSSNMSVFTPDYTSSDMKSIFDDLLTEHSDGCMEFASELAEVKLVFKEGKLSNAYIFNGEYTVEIRMREKFDETSKDGDFTKMLNTPEGMLDIIENVANAFPKSESR